MDHHSFGFWPFTYTRFACSVRIPASNPCIHFLVHTCSLRFMLPSCTCFQTCLLRPPHHWAYENWKLFPASGLYGRDIGPNLSSHLGVGEWRECKDSSESPVFFPPYTREDPGPRIGSVWSQRLVQG